MERPDSGILQVVKIFRQNIFYHESDEQNGNTNKKIANVKMKQKNSRVENTVTQNENFT